MRHDLRKWVGMVGLVAVAGIGIAGCGDDDEGGSGSGSVPGTGGSGGPPPSGHEVRVEARDDLSFDEGEYTAEAGEIEFRYHGGRIQHSLVVEGHEDDMRLLISGDEDEGSLELEAGEYVIYCDIPGHQAAGMEADLVVE